MRTAAATSALSSGRLIGKRLVNPRKNQVSGAIASRECDAMITRSKVDPDRPDPTIKNGAQFTRARGSGICHIALASKMPGIC
ncbi:MAG TPA: hypothetical protein VGF34_14080 [Stellaceae bacterium]|jgi:hypothetical protein